jgi:hypothetical protein
MNPKNEPAPTPMQRNAQAPGRVGLSIEKPLYCSIAAGARTSRTTHDNSGLAVRRPKPVPHLQGIDAFID